MPTTINQTMRGIINMGSSTSVTATIPSVNVAKTELRLLGVTCNNISADSPKFKPRLSLTNATTITSTLGLTSPSPDVGYDLTERT